MSKKQIDETKKKGFFRRHKILTIILILFIVIIGISSCNGGDTGYNAIDINTLETKDVMNGIKTEKIGEYETVNCDNTKLTDEELIKFYKEYIKDKDYNWVQIMFSDGTGLHFAGSSYVFTYSTIDEENGATNTKGTGYIITDEGEDKERVEYEGEDYTK